MRRSLIDIFKGMYVQMFRGATPEPVSDRVMSATMTHTRLKALQLSKVPVVEPVEEPDLSDPIVSTGRMKTRADMSHYRLAAYVASLEALEEEDNHECCNTRM